MTKKEVSKLVGFSILALYIVVKYGWKYFITYLGNLGTLLLNSLNLISLVKKGLPILITVVFVVFAKLTYNYLEGLLEIPNGKAKNIFQKSFFYV